MHDATNLTGRNRCWRIVRLNFHNGQKVTHVTSAAGKQKNPIGVNILTLLPIRPINSFRGFVPRRGVAVAFLGKVSLLVQIREVTSFEVFSYILLEETSPWTVKRSSPPPPKSTGIKIKEMHRNNRTDFKSMAQYVSNKSWHIPYPAIKFEAFQNYCKLNSSNTL